MSFLVLNLAHIRKKPLFHIEMSTVCSWEFFCPSFDLIKLHGTVRRIDEVKLTLKFPVIYLVFFEEDQSEVRMNSRDVLKILDVPV